MTYTTETIQNVFKDYEQQRTNTTDFYQGVMTDSRKIHMSLLGKLLTESSETGEINPQLAQQYALEFDEKATESAYNAITAGGHSDILKQRIVKSGLGINPGQAFIKGLQEQSIADFNGGMYNQMAQQDVNQISMSKYVSDPKLAGIGDKALADLYQTMQSANQRQQAQGRLEEMLTSIN